jgi:hypothetical protein
MCPEIYRFSTLPYTVLPSTPPHLTFVMIVDDLQTETTNFLRLPELRKAGEIRGLCL